MALVVEGGAAGWSATALAEAAPELVAIWHRPAEEGSELRLIAGSSTEDLAPIFVQVNRAAAALLVEHVVRVAGPGESAVDAYCGVGEYGRALARNGWHVRGIEADQATCDAARRVSAPGFSVLEGRVEERLAESLPADLLILNPPRSGLHPDVVRAISEHRLPRVIYVSCDPATLARDVAGLSPEYVLTGVRCFDLFPQTAHVETVLVMTARESA